VLDFRAVLPLLPDRRRPRASTGMGRWREAASKLLRFERDPVAAQRRAERQSVEIRERARLADTPTFLQSRSPPGRRKPQAGCLEQRRGNSGAFWWCRGPEHEDADDNARNGSEFGHISRASAPPRPRVRHETPWLGLLELSPSNGLLRAATEAQEGLTGGRPRCHNDIRLQPTSLARDSACWVVVRCELAE
jgi:hypothetical protein